MPLLLFPLLSPSRLTPEVDPPGYLYEPPDELPDELPDEPPDEPPVYKGLRPDDVVVGDSDGGSSPKPPNAPGSGAGPEPWPVRDGEPELPPEELGLLLPPRPEPPLGERAKMVMLVGLFTRRSVLKREYARGGTHEGIRGTTGGSNANRRDRSDLIWVS